MAAGFKFDPLKSGIGPVVDKSIPDPVSPRWSVTLNFCTEKARVAQVFCIDDAEIGCGPGRAGRPRREGTAEDGKYAAIAASILAHA